MISVLFAFALAGAPGGCSPHELDACRDTAQLVQDAGFQAELKRFVGERPTRFLTGGGRAYGESLAVLSGPADPVQKIGELYLFSACKDQSCEEKGAVALDAGGDIVAVGVLHTECAKLLLTRDCFERDTLSVFTVKGQEDQPLVETLSDWARRQVAASSAAPGAPLTRLARVEVIGSARPIQAEPVQKAEVAPAPKAKSPKLKSTASGKEAKVAAALTELAKQQAEAPRPQRQALAQTQLQPPVQPARQEAPKPQRLAQIDPAPTAGPPAAVQPPAVQAAAPPAAKAKPKPAKPKSEGWFKGWKWHWTPYD